MVYLQRAAHPIANYKSSQEKIYKGHTYNPKKYQLFFQKNFALSSGTNHYYQPYLKILIPI